MCLFIMCIKKYTYGLVGWGFCNDEVGPHRSGVIASETKDPRNLNVSTTVFGKMYPNKKHLQK